MYDKIKKIPFGEFDFEGFARKCIETQAPTSEDEVGEKVVSADTPFDFAVKNGELTVPNNPEWSPFRNMIIFYSGAIICSVQGDSKEGFISKPKFDNLYFWVSAYYAWAVKDQIKAQTVVKYLKETLVLMSSLLSDKNTDKAPENLIVEIVRQLEPLYEAECLLSNINLN